MKKYIVCGSYGDPKKAREYVRFSSAVEYATKEEAEVILKEWRTIRDYSYLWIEEVGK